MEQLVKVTGIAAPLLRINIDTDQIIPGREIMRGSREGYGPGLFGYWRYIDDRTPNPDFILNQEPWKHATILLALKVSGVTKKTTHGISITTKRRR